MKTVPSLVASSCIGVAAAGLAFGKPERSTSPRSSSRKRKPADLAEVVIHNRASYSPISRPGTSSTVVTPDNRPSRSSAYDPSKPPSAHANSSSTKLEHNLGRRFSITKHNEFTSPREFGREDTRRESVSSRGSWIKRLSTVPNSSNNSPRSSTHLDSSSVVLSQGSAAPILSETRSSPARSPPNKLVKRNQSGRAVSGPEGRRSRSRSQLPTLRRPATSHQRSVTLKQQFRDDSAITKDSLPDISPSQFVHTTHSRKYNSPEYRHPWRQYFESRPTKLSKERASGRSSEGAVYSFRTTSRRVVPDETVSPTLVKPAMILKSKTVDAEYDGEEEELELDDSNDEEIEESTNPAVSSTETQEAGQKRARRSLSMQFSSPSTWISRSGSLRIPKKNADGASGGKRYASNPMPGLARRRSATGHGNSNVKSPAISGQTASEQNPALSSDEASSTDLFAENFRAQSRNSSSPLPPLSRLSSFNVDLARLGLSSSSSSGPRRSPNSPALQTNTTATSFSSTGYTSAPFVATNLKGSRTPEGRDRASTLVGSDNDAKGFASGEEDDTDFQSETVFDSLRSGATSSLRSRNPPLDSMFDESPPSTNGSSKTKRRSIHEMLNNRGYHDGNGIIEEDEGMSTPVKARRSSQADDFNTPVQLDSGDSDIDIPSSPPSFSLATKDFGSLSLDDEDDDEDWTRDEDNSDVNNQLSPPSNSLNLRRVSPALRAILTNSTSGGSTKSAADRPKSNLFDWSEPPPLEKLDSMGNSPRPKTAHVKQNADGRGGRAGRRAPAALHIRSQSVPVVPDVDGQRDPSKLTPKFGTWGLGAKPISEDWDGDFEFESPDLEVADNNDNKMQNSGMLVPEAIQASQENVVGHVGQIREICLLVEDLKRLRTQGKERGLLDGPSAHLWREAEGIIILAAPEEEDDTLFPPQSPVALQSPTSVHTLQSIHSQPSVELDDEMPEEDGEIELGDVEQGLDANQLAQSGAPFDVLDRNGRPYGYMYDGKNVRRRSVFSPEDDIFGAAAKPPAAKPTVVAKFGGSLGGTLRLPAASPRQSSMKSSSEIARSVMENMHQNRSISDPLLQTLTSQSPNKLPFDTTSLKDLVSRAAGLTRTLGELVRKADNPLEDTDGSPHRESSPAFTRVFTPESPPRSNNSALETSPTRSLGRRMHMMTVV